MTIYVANLNGDWWEHKPEDPLFVLDTDKLSKEDLDQIKSEIGEDKFEMLIEDYGYEVTLSLDEVAKVS